MSKPTQVPPDSTAGITVDILQTSIRYLRLVAQARHEEQHNPTIPLARCADELCRTATHALDEIAEKLNLVASGKNS